MNYIELLNNYWALREQGILNRNVGDLYLYLINRSNSLGWKNPFNQKNLFICGFLGITEKTLIANRNKLKQEGLINFVSGIKGCNTEYTLIAVRNTSSNYREFYSKKVSESGNTSSNYSETDSENDSVSGSESNSETSGKTPDYIKHKLNKTKLNNEGGESASAGSDVLVTDPVSNAPPSSARPPTSNLFVDVDELKQQCLQDGMFYEPLCMRLHISLDQLGEWLEAFNKELRFGGEERKLRKDYRTHFSRWLPYRDLKSDPKQYSPVKEPINGSGKKNVQDTKPRGAVISGPKEYGQL